MPKTNKVTWKDVFEDYKKRHPRASKKCLGFDPYGFATILLLFPDRVRMTYNYDTKKVTRLKLDNNERRGS